MALVPWTCCEKGSALSSSSAQEDFACGTASSLSYIGPVSGRVCHEDYLFLKTDFSIKTKIFVKAKRALCSQWLWASNFLKTMWKPRFIFCFAYVQAPLTQARPNIYVLPFLGFLKGLIHCHMKQSPPLFKASCSTHQRSTTFCLPLDVAVWPDKQKNVNAETASSKTARPLLPLANLSYPHRHWNSWGCVKIYSIVKAKVV